MMMSSFLLKYKEAIDSGEILVGQELYLEISKLIEDMKDTDTYIYDTSDAELRINFIENCVRLTKSPYYGKPMKLFLWQKAFIEALYSFKMKEESEAAGFPIDRFKRSLLLIARKNTKALALDTRVPTPYGDKTIKYIQEGDYVYDENGSPVKVLATSEIFKDRDCYEITFEDGEIIICDENHRWTVQTNGSRNRAKYVSKSGRKSRCEHDLDDYACITLYTHEMINDYVHLRRDGKGCEYKYRVPMAKAIEHPHKGLFSPYFVGLWLGDGDKGDNRLAVAAEDLDQLIANLNHEGIEVSSVKCYQGNKYEVRVGTTVHKPKPDNSIRNELRNAGIWENKHIPAEYLEGSIDERLALLQGLMDTDGTISNAGQCSFTQKSKTMADGFSQLLSSLGIKHTISIRDIPCNGKICHAYWIQFWTDKRFPCFRYARKYARLKDRLADRMSYKSIIKIEKVSNRDTKCITVDSERGLFLCGQRNTVTHNSETSSALALTELILGAPGSDIVCSSNDDAQANILYDAINLMRQQVDPRDLDTKRNIRCILNKVNNTKIFKLSDKTKNKEGRNIDFSVIDEVHEMKDSVIVKSIEQSMSVKDNPKLILITTEGLVEGFLDAELKRARAIIRGEVDDDAADRYLPWLYTQDSELEVWEGNRDNRLWMKSNPMVGAIKKWSYLEEQVALAKSSKADRIFVLSKDFNIKQNAAESWLNTEDFSYEATYNIEDFASCVCIGGVDLAETTDLCAVKVMMMKKDDPVKYILSHYFIPESKLEDSDDKMAGARYEDWAKAGYLTITEGNDVDLSVIGDWFYKTLYKEYDIRLWKCGYDQRFSRDWINQMEKYGWAKTGGDDSDLIMINQNAVTLNNAIRLAEADFKHQLINYNNNPMDRWNFANAGLKVDNTGQALIVKMERGKRIDGAVALAILYETYRRVRSDFKSLVDKRG